MESNDFTCAQYALNLALSLENYSHTVHFEMLVLFYLKNIKTNWNLYLPRATKAPNFYGSCYLFEKFLEKSLNCDNYWY